MTLAGHAAFVRRAGFSPDGTRLVTTGLDHTVKIWDLGPSHEVFAIPNPSSIGATHGITKVKYSRLGDRLAASFEDGNIFLWDAANGNQLMELKGHTDKVADIVFSPDGSRLLSGSGDETARIWDLRTGINQVTLGEHQGMVGALAYSPDGKYVASGDDYPSNAGIIAGNMVKIWDPNSGEVIKTFPTEGWIQSIDYSPDGSQLLVSNQVPPHGQFMVTNWDIITGKPVFTRTLSSLSERPSRSLD